MESDDELGKKFDEISRRNARSNAENQGFVRKSRRKGIVHQIRSRESSSSGEEYFDLEETESLLSYVSSDSDTDQILDFYKIYRNSERNFSQTLNMSAVTNEMSLGGGADTGTEQKQNLVPTADAEQKPTNNLPENNNSTSDTESKLNDEPMEDTEPESTHDAIEDTEPKLYHDRENRGSEPETNYDPSADDRPEMKDNPAEGDLYEHYTELSVLVESQPDPERDLFYIIKSDTENITSAEPEYVNCELPDGEAAFADAVDVRNRRFTTQTQTLDSWAPRIPVIKVLSDLKIGRSIMIEGQCDYNPRSFSINLQSNSVGLPGADILFMFGFNFTDDITSTDGSSIVCNSHLYESWGLPVTYRAQQMEDKTFPFTPGKKFAIRIAILPGGFQVFTHERKLIFFPHRSSVDRVKYIRMEGDFEVLKMQCPRQMVLPHIYIPEFGVRAGQVLLLDTFIKQDAKRFQFQLSARHNDVYTGFFMRMRFDGDITHIQCQGFLNDQLEESVTFDGNLPIIPGMELEIRAIIRPTRFEIFMDGERFAEYDHTLPLEKMSQITVVGDIHLYAVHIMEPKSRMRHALGRRRRCGCQIL